IPVAPIFRRTGARRSPARSCRPASRSKTATFVSPGSGACCPRMPWRSEDDDGAPPVAGGNGPFAESARTPAPEVAVFEMLENELVDGDARREPVAHQLQRLRLGERGKAPRFGADLGE